MGRRSSSVRTNSGSEGYRAENLGLIPPLVCYLNEHALPCFAYYSVTLKLPYHIKTKGQKRKIEKDCWQAKPDVPNSVKLLPEGSTLGLLPLLPAPDLGEIWAGSKGYAGKGALRSR